MFYIEHFYLFFFKGKWSRDVPGGLSVGRKSCHAQNTLEILCFGLDKVATYGYNIQCKEGNALLKGGEGMDEMTAPELNAFLENLARLIEASAQNVEDAARLVRESKVKA